MQPFFSYNKHNHIKLSAWLVLVVLLVIKVNGESLVKGLTSLSDEFARKAPAPKEGQKITIAVFPFETTEKLQKNRTNFAVVEILAKKLAQTGTFQLVERTELQRVFDEQKLALSGAIEEETAVKVGQLAGARVAVLGSINKLGKKYQISARLVDNQTASVLVVMFFEVPVKVFDQEAAPYLVTYVPERQAIGLYFIGGIRDFSAHPPIANAEQYSVTFPAGTYTFSVEKQHYPDIDGNIIGIGARYFPWKWVMADIVYHFIGPYNTDYNSFVITYHPGLGSDNYTLNIKSSGLSFSLNGVYQPLKWLRLFAGPGMDCSFLTFRIKSYGGDWNYEYWADDYTVYTEFLIDPGSGQIIDKDDPDLKLKTSLFQPFIRTGFEWRPQSRLGLAAWGNFYLGKGSIDPILMKTTIRDRNVNWKILGPDENGIEVLRIKDPGFSLQGSASFYF